MAVTLALPHPSPPHCASHRPSLPADQVQAKVTSSQCAPHVGLRRFLTSTPRRHRPAALSRPDHLAHAEAESHTESAACLSSAGDPHLHRSPASRPLAMSISTHSLHSLLTPTPSSLHSASHDWETKSSATAPSTSCLLLFLPRHHPAWPRPLCPHSRLAQRPPRTGQLPRGHHLSLLPAPTSATAGKDERRQTLPLT